MRYLVILLILLLGMAGLAGAAITDYYVTADGTADWADAVNSASPASLTTAFANAAAGDRVNIKKGIYTRTGNDTPANRGTDANAIIYRGYNVTPGDLDDIKRVDGWQRLDTTNYPVIAYNAFFRHTGFSLTHTAYLNLVFTGDVNSNVASIGGNSIFHNCAGENANTGSAATVFNAGNNTIISQVDAALTGASGGDSAIVSLGTTNPALIYNCLVYRSPNHGIRASGYVTVSQCLVYGVTNYGIYYNTATQARTFYLLNSTVYSGKGISTSSTNFTMLHAFISNHVTDSGEYSFQNPHASGSQVLFLKNRMRGNTSGNISWNGDYVISVGNIITGATDPEVDYVSPINTPLDYRLVTTADGAWAALHGGDIGALQHRPEGDGTPCPTPENTPTITPTPTYTATMTETPTMTPEPTNTPYPTYTPEPTYTPGVGGARRPNVQYFGR